jgi:hypothetical protein
VLLTSKDTFKYGERISTAYGDLMIRKVKESDLFLLEDSKSLRILITNFNVVEGFREKLVVESLSKTSSIVQISITDGVIDKSEAS